MNFVIFFNVLKLRVVNYSPIISMAPLSKDTVRTAGVYCKVQKFEPCSYQTSQESEMLRTILTQKKQKKQLDINDTDIARVFKSRRMKHVTRMGREEVRTGFWWGNLRERVH